MRAETIDKVLHKKEIKIHNKFGELQITDEESEEEKDELLLDEENAGENIKSSENISKKTKSCEMLKKKKKMFENISKKTK